MASGVAPCEFAPRSVPSSSSELSPFWAALPMVKGRRRAKVTLATCVLKELVAL